jgi:hypothetical protein
MGGDVLKQSVSFVNFSITFMDTERIGSAEFCTVQIQNAHQEMGFCYKKRMQTEKEGRRNGGRAELGKHFLLH